MTTSPAQQPIIQASDLVPAYREEAQPPQLDCRIAAQGITCLLGRPGQRLDAYLRCLGGITAVRQGQLLLLGQNSAQIDARQWPRIRTQLAYLSRATPLLSVLNGIENVILPVRYHGQQRREEAEAIAHDLLAQLQYQGDLQQLPAYMSSLQRTQLAIARAAILEPRALLMDHPFHELELYEYPVLEDFLHNWAHTRAVLIATQHLHFAKTCANSVVFIGDNLTQQFPSWEAMCQSGEPEIEAFLKLYHDNHDL